MYHIRYVHIVCNVSDGLK